MPAQVETIMEQRNHFAKAIREFIITDANRLPKSPNPVKPDHYVSWKWPLHPVSSDYRITAAEWNDGGIASIGGVDYPILIATIEKGVFGRCEALRVEALGPDRSSMIFSLNKAAKPLLKRRSSISEILGFDAPFVGSIRDLSTLEQLKLLYSRDRTIAHDAQVEIETGPFHKHVFDACIEILNDRIHPHRRTAQWLVLDLFEDLPSVTAIAEDDNTAIDAIFRLMDEAKDDFARTIFKAGVVLGGHICSDYCVETLIKLTRSESRIARRSAVHACFHLVEWLPECKDMIVAAVQFSAQNDSEPMLKSFSAGIARDILAGEVDHVIEPTFKDEV